MKNKMKTMQSGSRKGAFAMKRKAIGLILALLCLLLCFSAAARASQEPAEPPVFPADAGIDVYT